MEQKCGFSSLWRKKKRVVEKSFRNLALLLTLTLLGAISNVSAATVNYSGTWANLTSFISSASVAATGDVLVLNPATLGIINTAVTVGKDVTITSSDPATPLVMSLATTRHFTIGAGGILTLQNITLDGGNIGGGITFSTIDRTLILNSGAIIQNCVSATHGGGISANQTGSIIKVNTGVIIRNNAALSGNGGGIYTIGEITMTGGKINNNFARLSGGGIYTSNATANAVVISGGEIHGNWTGDDSTSAGATGGGIHANAAGSKITLSGTTSFAGNGINNNGKITTGYGGAIDTSGLLEITGDVVINYNASMMSGGGINHSNSTVNALTISGNTVIKGNYSNFGGGISLKGGGTISGNVSITDNGKDAAGKTYTERGGGIYAGSAAMLQISGSGGGTVKISNNAATGDGGGIYADNLNNLTVGANVSFSGNKAFRPWWLENTADSHSYNLYNAPITVAQIKALNQVPNNVSGSNITLSAPPASNPSFKYAYNNYDINFVGSINYVTDWERLRQFVENASGTYSNTLVIYKKSSGQTTDFTANPARMALNDFEDYIENDGGTAPAVFIEVSRNVTIQSANASDVIKLNMPFGRASCHFSLEGSGKSFTLENIILDGMGTGGGVAIYDAMNVTLTLNTGAIIQNCEGGAITISSDSEYSTINVNSGAIIRNNHAQYGGGIGIYTADCQVVVAGGTITGNTADDDGGGIHIWNKGNYTSTITVSSGTIAGNTAGKDGGGIFTADLNKLTVASGVIFSGNKAGSPWFMSRDLGAHSYNPGTPITVTQIKALNKIPNNVSGSNIALSAPPTGNNPFKYAYNNYDVNYVGTFNSDCSYTTSAPVLPTLPAMAVGSNQPGIVNLEILSGLKPTIPGGRLIWDNGSNPQPYNAISTAVTGTRTYYVSQVADAYCPSSPTVPVTLNIIASCPSATASVSQGTINIGAPQASVTVSNQTGINGRWVSNNPDVAVIANGTTVQIGTNVIAQIVGIAPGTATFTYVSNTGAWTTGSVTVNP